MVSDINMGMGSRGFDLIQEPLNLKSEQVKRHLLPEVSALEPTSLSSQKYGEAYMSSQEPSQPGAFPQLGDPNVQNVHSTASEFHANGGTVYGGDGEPIWKMSLKEEADEYWIVDDLDEESTIHISKYVNNGVMTEEEASGLISGDFVLVPAANANGFTVASADEIIELPSGTSSVSPFSLSSNPLEPTDPLPDEFYFNGSENSTYEPPQGTWSGANNDDDSVDSDAAVAEGESAPGIQGDDASVDSDAAVGELEEGKWSDELEGEWSFGDRVEWYERLVTDELFGNRPARPGAPETNLELAEEEFVDSLIEDAPP